MDYDNGNLGYQGPYVDYGHPFLDISYQGNWVRITKTSCSSETVSGTVDGFDPDIVRILMDVQTAWHNRPPDTFCSQWPAAPYTYGGGPISAKDHGLGTTGYLHDTGNNGLLTFDSQVDATYDCILVHGGCQYNVSPNAQSFPFSGGSGVFSVTVNNGCAWQPSSDSSWIALVPGPISYGNGPVSFIVARNPGPARTGRITVAGKTFTVTQDASPSPNPAGCTYSLVPDSVTVAVGGGTGSVAVFTSAGCAWTASKNDAWVSLTSGGSGTGPGGLTFSVTANTSGAPRATNLTIAGISFPLMQPASASALRFVPIAPCRVVDTRSPGSYPVGGARLKGGETRAFDIASGNCGIPASASAYSLNATVVPAGPSLGYLSLWPSDKPQPLVSTLNSFDGRIRANAAIVPAAANGSISAFVTDPSDLIFDLDGYFVPAATEGSLAFYPVTPCRIADTRSDAPNLSISGGASRDFPISGFKCGIPASAQAYSLNVTAVPRGALGYITVWGLGASQPLASTLNAPTGQVTANAALVPAGRGGGVSVYASNTSDVVLDINGYFAAPDPAGFNFYTVTPCRVSDTRVASMGAFGTPYLAAAETRAYAVPRSQCGPPASARAWALNATVVPRGGPLLYLSLWPADKAQPLVSTLNSFDGAVLANMAFVPGATADGAIKAYVTNATDLIFDINGYFAP